MKSNFPTRVFRAFTLVGLVAGATVTASIPARSQDVGAYLRHICECKWLLLTDPAKQVEECGPFSPIVIEGTLSSTKSGSPAPIYEPEPEPEPEPEMEYPVET